MPYITLTGADDSTSLDDLWRLAGQHRFGLVEWGVLYDATRQGQGRYPSLDWIKRLAARLEHPGARPPAFALHLCGRQAVGDFLAGTGHVCEVAKHFGRIQLNFRQDDYPLDQVDKALRRNLNKQIITPHNEANASLWEPLFKRRNHAVLFDASAGRGISPEQWATPFAGVPCGYAGGLGPDNLATELPRIHAAAAGDHYWLDLEAKLRNSADQFDLVRAKQCLDIASAFYLDKILAPQMAVLFKPLPAAVVGFLGNRSQALRQAGAPRKRD